MLPPAYQNLNSEKGMPTYRNPTDHQYSDGYSNDLQGAVTKRFLDKLVKLGFISPDVYSSGALWPLDKEGNSFIPNTNTTGGRELMHYYTEGLQQGNYNYGGGRFWNAGVK
jgi:hypothetical protein